MRGSLALARCLTFTAAAGVLALLAVPLAAAVATAAPATRPPRVMILIDANTSPDKTQLTMERQAALAYVGALPADAQAGLITFSDSWRSVLAPTASRSSFATALASVQLAGPTSKGISDALAAAAAAIGGRGASSGSRILVMSDGEHLPHATSAVTVPIDAVTWSFDSDDFARTVRQLALASDGQVAGLAHAVGLAAAVPAAPAPAPAKPPPAHVAAQAQSGFGLSSSLVSVLATVFVAFFVLALMVLRSLRRGDRRPRLAGQIDRYGPNAATPVAVQAADGDGKVARTALGLMTQVLSARKAEPKLALRLDHAGITRPPAEWALLGLCVSVGLTAAFTLLFGNVLVGVAVGVLAGWLGMRLALSLRIRRRRAAFDDQLPTVLQLVAGSIQTGLSLAQGLDTVVREDTQPAAGEFARALAETRIGADLADALDNVAARLGSADLRWVVMAIRIQRETGGNLAEVLRNTVATMRERAYLRRQVRTLSAEGRLSAYVLLGMPIVVGGWLFYSNPTYMEPLYTTLFGWTMLTGATALVVIGAVWMRNLINVKV